MYICIYLHIYQIFIFYQNKYLPIYTVSNIAKTSLLWLVDVNIYSYLLSDRDLKLLQQGNWTEHNCMVFYM